MLSRKLHAVRLVLLTEGGLDSVKRPTKEGKCMLMVLIVLTVGAGGET